MSSSPALNLSSVKLPTLAEIQAERTRRRIEAERRNVARNGETIRQRCKTLSGFVREAWHIIEPEAAYVHGWHIDAICSHLEAVTRGEITRLLINVPPGTMKSLLVAVFWPAWEWGPGGRAGMRYLTTSYSDMNVIRDNTRMRRLIESDWYKALWPEVQLAKDQNAKGKFENTRTGAREGRAFGSLTGGRGDRVIIDDPHSTETAESEAERANTTRIFRESVPLRVNDAEKSAIIVIMQRLHENDVSGVTLQLGLNYVHLMLPMEYEPERGCETAIGFKDPRTYDGELLFPERFPRPVVERDKIPLGGYAVAGQFQQRPAPREGGLLKRAWFAVVDAVPAGARKVRAWDLADSEAANAAFTAGVKMSEFNGEYFIEQVTRFRSSKKDKMIKSIAEQDGKSVRIRLPQDPGQAGRSQVRYIISLLAGFIVRAVPVTGDKVTRASPLASQAEAGNVKLLRGAWNDAFLDEAGLFPGGAYKDQIDAAADAFNELVASAGSGIIIAKPIIVTGSRPGV